LAGPYILVGPPNGNDECKEGGWREFGFPRRFKNQGDCVSYLATAGKYEGERN